MPPKSKSPETAENQPSFEAALTRLEEIVAQLERGEITLDESLKAFREGSDLVKLCLARLSQAEATVEELMAGEDGSHKITKARRGLEGDDDAEV